MRNVLLDSGPLIALFAIDDKHHDRFDGLVKKYASQGLRLLTTWPCVVEASYLLRAPQRYEMLTWIENGGALVYPFEPHHLGDMVVWMKRYSVRSNREMDLADASLYWLAVEADVIDMMTIDLADFSRYRLPDGRAFNVL